MRDTPFQACCALSAERPADRPLVEELIARAFGPGRYAKTAERLREGNRPVADLCFVAWAEEGAVGCVRLWPVRIGGAKALLLGPIAVDETHQSRGLGAALIGRACDEAAGRGHGLVILVGDESYFGPLGFSAALAGAVVMPGPVDRRRVLVRALAPHAADGLKGQVVSAPRA
jgi:predicted N-acetyltransferase YhbS